jgi:hypothetical protein
MIPRIKNLDGTMTIIGNDASVDTKERVDQSDWQDFQVNLYAAAPDGRSHLVSNRPTQSLELARFIAPRVDKFV